MNVDEWIKETNVPEWAQGICKLTWAAAVAQPVPTVLYCPMCGSIQNSLELQADGERFRLFFDAFFVALADLPPTPRQQGTLIELENSQPRTTDQLRAALDRVLLWGPK